MLADRKNSPSSGRPSTSRRTVWVRLPCATAAMARVTSAVGRSRSSTSVLTETSISPHAPRDSWNRVRSRVLPSLPTTCPTRFSSCAMCWLAATISLKVSAIFPARPAQEPGSRTEKSPSRMLCRLVRMTVRSRDPSESFGFPLLDFPFFARLGAGFQDQSARFRSVRFVSLFLPKKGAFRFSALPHLGSQPNQRSFVDIHVMCDRFNTTFGGVRISNSGKGRWKRLPERRSAA